MIGITNLLPDDPSGASAAAEDSHLVDGSPQLLGAGATGTEEGPAGIPAALVGTDRDGDPVDAPPAARSDGDTGGSTSTGPGEQTTRCRPPTPRAP